MELLAIVVRWFAYAQCLYTHARGNIKQEPERDTATEQESESEPGKQEDVWYWCGQLLRVVEKGVWRRGRGAVMSQ